MAATDRLDSAVVEGIGGAEAEAGGVSTDSGSKIGMNHRRHGGRLLGLLMDSSTR
ncbi:hypothetical protein LINGRAHAP2_LOCUS6288 [Linum grandiflorum]